MARPRSVRPQGCHHNRPTVTTVDGRTVVSLNWSGHHSAAPGERCASCERPTLVVDCDGMPRHKTCAERDMARELTAAGHRYAANAPDALAS
ncbi:hypothetical protein OOJ91_34300 [Micromonospora lupini]|uniref:hypothetical protein n=1 Tax=Micromonospora lupini TaxID=285679 RepID=UPI00224F70B8|nr:hypothetical protein [Micromonospora lupini]MCX5070922.1 hypothetical protein [Micromonospora lupini]